ncbi:MAG: NAD(P)H-hydrate epimerase, partial [Cyclobacteriaceae bacterium]|nr:NAD(P)H-hydrate epimerase [Cyclobacteriaceae bacterium]
MTKILSSKQIREVDQYTIEHKPIASIDLMENASHAFVNCFTKNHRPEDNIKIFCGTGNNGGDGLAISRILLAQGFHIITYCIGDLSKASSDFKINFERLERVSQPIILDSKIKFPKLGDSDIVIDGIFGAGLSRPATGLFGKLIDWINGSNQKKTVAIDIASGLYCDQNTSGTKIIECNHTI